MPTAAYHAEELVPVGIELDRRGHQVTFLTTRAAPQEVNDAMGSWQGPLFAWPRHFSLVPRFDAVVVMNDWGPTRSLVDLARARGVTSFAKVEGVQDFEDVDTGRVRRPYRQADVVLAQGRNDLEALPGADAHVVGSHRLEAIFRAPERSRWNDPPVAVINSNFTYGVLPEVRQWWLDAAIDAAIEAGCRVLVSRHPAELHLPSGHPVAGQPMSRLLETVADVLISRFSTVPFEAMARGVPFVYFNPHKERVPTFTEPQGAFPVVVDTALLAGEIGRVLGWRGSYRGRSQRFFRAQVDISEDATSASRTACAISDHLEDTPRLVR